MAKIVGGWGSAPDPAGGAHSAPPDPLAALGWDGDFKTLYPPVKKSWVRACFPLPYHLHFYSLIHAYKPFCRKFSSEGPPILHHFISASALGFRLFSILLRPLFRRFSRFAPIANPVSTRRHKFIHNFKNSSCKSWK